MTEQIIRQRASQALVRAGRRSDLAVRHAGLVRATSGELPDYVTVDEYRAAAGRLEGRLREHALLRALWELGPRLTELLAVQVAEVDFHIAVVRLITLKKRRKAPHLEQPRPIRALPVSSGLLGEIARLIAQHSLPASARLFPWSRSRAYEIVRDALEAAGVEHGRACPRAMRHGHAVHALKHGVPLNVVQVTLGHSSPVTTGIYTRVLGRDIRDYYAEVDW